MAGLQVLGLHLHVGLVDSEGFADLNVGNKECKFSIKVQQKYSESLCNLDPVLGK